MAAETAAAAAVAVADGVRLDELPAPLLVKISQLLPAEDLPSLACGSRALAALAPDFYAACTAVDMLAFGWVSPQLCDQVIRRFRGAKLRTLTFSLGVFRYESFWCPEAISRSKGMPRYSEQLEARVLARFRILILSQYQSVKLLVNLLYGRSVPRPMDVLVHAYFLEQMLLSQPQLESLTLDCEGSVREWPLENGVHEAVIVSSSSPNLQQYTHRTSYRRTGEACTLDVGLDFLERCPRLRAFNKQITFSLGSIERWQHLPTLLLECAEFDLSVPDYEPPRWHMAEVAEKFKSLHAARVKSNNGMWLSVFGTFLLHLPVLQKLSIGPCLYSNNGAFDGIGGGSEDEPSTMEGLFSFIPPTVTSLSICSLGGLPDLVALLQHPVPKFLRELHVEVRGWPNQGLTVSEERALEGLVTTSDGLQVYSIRVLQSLSHHDNFVVYSLHSGDQ
eukprot:SM000116S24230  [mRNA]  locus=s116:214979:217926:+ [translate_table: standard]